MFTISRTCRFSLAATLLLTVAFNAAAFSTAQEITDRTQPSALLTTEMNRGSLTEGILAAWASEVQKSNPEFTRQKLSAALQGLRADHLLAASMAKSATALLDILTNAVVPDDASSALHVSAKTLGSTTLDLVFTPLNPCRLVDTRLAGGPWAPGFPRTYVGFTATNFTAQGGAASNCGIPNGVAALAIEAIALNPPADGWFYLWPGNIAQPPSSTFNYGPALSAITFGTILPVDGSTSNQFKANSSQAAHLIVDVVGYFAAPFATALQCVDTTPVTFPINLVVGSQFYAFATPAACAAGYTPVALRCATDNAQGSTVETISDNCSGTALVNTLHLSASRTCCRVPGR